MYKRYLEPNSSSLPTNYIVKKLKLKENIDSNAITLKNASFDSLDVLNTRRKDLENVIVSGGADFEMSDRVDLDTGDVVDQEDMSRDEEERIVDNDNFFQPITDELIHPNLECKTSDAVLMILAYFLRHRLTWVALEDLLKLFSCVLGNDSRLPKTKYFFKKCFGKDDSAVFHFYCKNCDLYIGTYEEVKNMKDVENVANEDPKKKHKEKMCMNCEQVFSLEKLNDGKFFIQLPIKSQIEEKLRNNPNILDFDTNPNSNNCITDVFDCELYKSLKEKNKNFKLLTLTLNTDGVRVFKSKAKASLWPFQMFLNEVPLNKRFKQENIILSGISFGKDPDFNVYLRPLVQELQKIDQDKIKVHSNNSNYEIALRVLLVSSDSPARCKVMKLKQYNGEFGCTYCLHPGVALNDSNVRKYVITKDRYCLRTHSETVKLMKQYLETGIGNLGVKGVSPLLGLPHYDLIRGTVVDYMHAVLLGVVYLLLSLWFDSENHFQKFYISPRGTEAVNRNIKCMQPPRSFTRQPRSIDEKEFWKANELRNWLLFYALPCLHNILKEPYLSHFSLLSEAIFIFLTAEISEAELKRASNDLNEFVIKFETYYGKENMMYNVHLLEHLPKCVKDCGALFLYSNFNFESSNGFLIKNVNGTTNVEHQLAEKYFLNNVLANLKSSSISTSTLNYIKENNNRVKYCKKVGPITLFGKPRKYVLNFHEKLILKQTKRLSYSKFHYMGDVYYSSKFKRSKKRNDTTVFLKDKSFGEISLIFEENETVFLILKKLQVALLQEMPKQIKKMLTNVADEYILVSAEEISEKCVLIKTSKATFISLFPNRFESD